MHVLLSPLGLAVSLALMLALLWRRLPRAVRWIGLLLQFLLIVAMCPLGANALVWQIESRVPTDTCLAPTPDTIVVLSGGFEREPAGSEDFPALEATTIKRAMAGVTLWKRMPHATLVFAGGGPFAISESAVLQRFAEQLGVPAASIRREERSQTTWENAVRLRALAPGLPAHIWLVSSALHLPRALVAFRAAGFEPCAYVSERRYLAPSAIGYFLPQSSALAESETAIHELIGELVYRLRQRWSSSNPE